MIRLGLIGRIVKGSKISLEVTLPQLGPLKVVGTQFGDSVSVSIETSSSNAQNKLTESFATLLKNIQEEVDPNARVSIKRDLI